MSERSSFRGGFSSRGGGRGGGHGGHHGGGGGAGGGRGRGHRGGGARDGGGAGHQQRAGGDQQQQEKPKKENILDLTKYMDREVTVKFSGGREVTGVLKGYDQLMNLVLDDVKERMRDENDKMTTRNLGLIVARGTLLVLLSPVDGSEEIANPFMQQQEEE
ncbi:Sm-like protein lsm7 [Myotisia sp. PD_48]|nr:Sm-like protein lsm7 [Myotisia sp. PD_48]